MKQRGIFQYVILDIPVQIVKKLVVLKNPTVVTTTKIKRRMKMNEFLKAMKKDTNYGLTENGGVKHLYTLNKVLDMFAMGGAMRNRSEDDIITMFMQAYKEDRTLALRCLFYLRDVRGGKLVA